MLGFARMLGRGADKHILVFAGKGKGDLAFQIHVILPADPDLALDPVGSAGKSLDNIAALQLERLGDIGIAGFLGLKGINLRRQGSQVTLTSAAALRA